MRPSLAECSWVWSQMYIDKGWGEVRDILYLHVQRGGARRSVEIGRD